MKDKKIKIHHIHSNYNWGAYSVIRSIHEELDRRTTLTSYDDADIIWYTGTSSKLRPPDNKKVICSMHTEPLKFNPEKYKRADLYLTNSKLITEKYKGTIWFPTYADKRYFKPVDVPVKYDCVFIGSLPHPSMNHRKKYIDNLRDSGYRVAAIGKGHKDNLPFATGKALIELYSSAKVILDFGNEESSMTSRPYQGLMCGTPVVTYRRADMIEMLGDNVSYYSGYDEFKEAIDNVINNYDEFKSKALANRDKIAEAHDVSARVDLVWDKIKGLVE